MKIIVLLLSLTALAAARRIRVRPASQESIEEEEAPQQQLYYQTADEDSNEEQRHAPVILSRQDNYARALNTRTQQQSLQPKLKAASAKVPPVQTIRNYNKLNDDGSFTFGYEAADGSFKEETRGTDCVVRGKYGYIDPDGNKREFTYVSGNPCDPNAVKSEEEEDLPSSGEENVPQNIPRRPNIPLKARPVTTTIRPRPAQTVFQQDYNRDEESEEENVPNIPTRAPFHQNQNALKIPTFAQLEQEIRPQSLRPTPAPKLLVSTPQRQSISITPRPSSLSQPPATTYRPQLVRVTSTAAPPPPTPSKLPALDLDAELKNFQLEHNVVSTPRPQAGQPAKGPGSPIYTSELVFDPQSGQYNTVLYQQLPHNQGDFNLRGRLQSFVPPQQQFHNVPFQPQQFPQQQFQPQPFFQPQPRPFAQRPPTPSLPAYQAQPQRALYEQQKSALVQQSQQLYAAQQNKQLQEKPQRFPPQLLRQEPQRFSQPEPQRFHNPAPQPFYFISPNGDRSTLSNGQIDSFLRGHSLSI